jgi:hypothetical protein
MTITQLQQCTQLHFHKCNNGGSDFLRNVGQILQEYTVSHLRRLYFSDSFYTLNHGRIKTSRHPKLYKNKTPLQDVRMKGIQNKIIISQKESIIHLYTITNGHYQSFFLSI